MAALNIDVMTGQQDREISAVVEREGPRLRHFIRARLADPSEVEDLLQEFFLELVEAYPPDETH